MTMLPTPPGDPLVLDQASLDAAGLSLTRSAWRRLRRNPGAIVGAVIVAVFLLVALCAPLLTSYRPGSGQWADQITLDSVPGPGHGHLLGLDRFGSDLWTQMVYGARSSLFLGVVSTLIGLTVGMVLGAVSGGFAVVGGRFGRRVDNVLMRCVDIMLSVPSLLLAISIAAILGANVWAVILAVGAAQVPFFARLLRGSMFAQSGEDYVLAATALGLRKRRIVIGHVLPNSIGPTIVQATLGLATATIEVASLSFLGLGQSDPAAAEWGRMLVAAQDRFDVAPQLAIYPGVAIAVTALGFTLLGEAMREALDPRSRR
ncbi:MAG: ABC transporter permease [Nocardioides sp.]|uniref:ABC transporter permease n=1 Tax=Nocardioides sp. TaxID=35761 RepID=UPI0039E6435B